MIGRDLMMFPAALALMAVAAMAVRRRYTFGRTFLLLCFTSYACALVAVTMLPIPIDPRLIADRTAAGFLGNNFVPFSSIVGAFRDGIGYFALQVGGNLALLAPFGLCFPALFPSSRGLRRSLTVILVAAISIEVAQYAVSAIIGYTYRQADVDDIILNVAGGLIGYALFCLVSLVAARVSARSHARLSNRARLDDVPEAAS